MCSEIWATCNDLYRKSLRALATSAPGSAVLACITAECFTDQSSRILHAKPFIESFYTTSLVTCEERGCTELTNVCACHWRHAQSAFLHDKHHVFRLLPPGEYLVCLGPRSSAYWCKSPWYRRPKSFCLSQGHVFLSPPKRLEMSTNRTTRNCRPASCLS